MPRDAQLEAALARIRGLLESPMRGEDPECCLFCISEIVQEMIGDRAGIGPEDERENKKYEDC